MGNQLTRIKLILGILLLSLLTNSIPPLLPMMQKGFELGIFQSSILPMVMTLSMMSANLLVGMLISSVGRKQVILLSLVLCIAGFLVAYFAATFIILLSAFCLFGFALGSGFTGLTTVYAALPRKMQNYGLFHAFFGLGGIIAPLHVSFWLGRGQGYKTVFFVYSVVYIIFLAVILMSRDIKNQQQNIHTHKNSLENFSSQLIIIGLLFFGFYAAVEVGATTWSMNLLTISYEATYSHASYILSAFWVVYTLSRFFTDFIGKKIGAVPYLFISLFMALLLLPLILLGISPYLFIAFGFAVGPVFPVIQKYITSNLAEEQRGFFIGFSYAATGISASVFLPLMGAIGEKDIRLSYIPLIVLIVLLLILVRTLQSFSHKEKLLNK